MFIAATAEKRVIIGLLKNTANQGGNIYGFQRKVKADTKK